MQPTREIGEISASARRVAATLIEIAHTRIELGATELAEERARLAQQALVVTAALFFLGVGLVLGVLALAWWAGPQDGARVLGLAALVALVMAAAAVMVWQRIVRGRPPPLHDTLTQLRADARALSQEVVP
jgi:uncharacterized membrane protein YqjE